MSESGEGKAVIVCDIDGTLFDVQARIARSLEDLGVEAGDHPAAVADALQKPLRSRFFDLFLSEKYAHLDQPIAAMLEFVSQLQASTGMPLVLLTGRPDEMKKVTRSAVAATGLDVAELILRARRERYQKTTEFKVNALKRRGYVPHFAIDDDAEILAAFRQHWPEASLLQVRGEQATPWND